MFCDGACSNNGRGGDGGVQPRGGCGVAFTSKEDTIKALSRPLEFNGIPHTSNRAELRAVILGLDRRVWTGEGFESLVIACDSEYVVLGITERLQTWIRRGWRTSAGTPVANADLWKELLERLRVLEGRGCHVQFWQIPREWNEADEYAKKAAAVSNPLPKGLCRVVGGRPRANIGDRRIIPLITHRSRKRYKKSYTFLDRHSYLSYGNCAIGGLFFSCNLQPLTPHAFPPVVSHQLFTSLRKKEREA